jgi:hypothetical protein
MTFVGIISKGFPAFSQRIATPVNPPGCAAYK